jgi:hypothetical protein
MHCFAFGLAGTFAMSDDEGQTWAVSQLASMASLTVLSATCPSTDRCVALAKLESPSSVPAGQQSPPGVALYSADGGRSWSTAAVSGSAAEFLGGLSCPSSTVCYAIAAGLAPPGYTAISCPDPTYCAALGAGTVGEVVIAR